MLRKVRENSVTHGTWHGLSFRGILVLSLCGLAAIQGNAEPTTGSGTSASQSPQQVSIEARLSDTDAPAAGGIAYFSEAIALLGPDAATGVATTTTLQKVAAAGRAVKLDEHGRATLAIPPASRVRSLAIEFPGYLRTPDPAIRDVTDSTHSLTLHPGRRVEGAVMDAAGKAVAETNVIADFGDIVCHGETDTEGHYSIYVPEDMAGAWTVRRAGFPALKFQTEPGTNPPPSIKLAAGNITINGHIRVAGKHDWAYGRRGSMYGHESVFPFQCDATGEFKVAGLSPGDYTWQILDTLAGGRLEVGETSGTAERVLFDIPERKFVTVRLRSADGQSAIDNTVFRVSRVLTAADGGISGISITWKSDASGNSVFEYFFPGEYRVSLPTTDARGRPLLVASPQSFALSGSQETMFVHAAPVRIVVPKE
jgi:hypothetical protein